MAQRRRSKRGGFRENAGRGAMFPGKVQGGEFVAKRVYGVLTEVGHDALMRKQQELTEQEGRQVSTNETLEYCIRKATRTPLAA